MWALAWQTHALTTNPARLFDANIYHPVPNTLAYGPMGTGALLVFAPVFAVSGNPVLAMNFLFLGGIALTAWTIGLVATRWTQSAAAGAVAGATYLAVPWVLYDWVPACPHFALLMWLPLIMERAARPVLRRRDGVALAVMVTMQAAVEVVYIAPAVFVPLALIMIVRLSRRHTRISGLYLGGAILAALIALSPMLSAHAAARRANPGLAEQTTWRSRKGGPPRSATPWSLFGLEAGRGQFPPPPPMALPPLAFALIGGAVLSRAVQRRGKRDEQAAGAWRHAALWTVTATALALPLRIIVFDTILDNPQMWLREVVPALRVMRVPARLGAIGLVGLSLLSGLAFAEVVRCAFRRWHGRPRMRVVGGAMAALIAPAILQQPRTGWGYPPGFVVRSRAETYPVSPLKRDVPYASVLRADGGPLLEIGIGLFGPPAETLAMVRSIDHWRPLLNGYGSYWPKQYERSVALAKRLPGDLDALSTLRAETGVELILVWLNQLPPGADSAWQAVVRSRGNPVLVLVGEGEQEAVLFRVRGTASPPEETESGTSDDRR